MSSPKDLRHAIPTTFRGYDRERTNTVMQALADELKSLKWERDELGRQLDEATRELAEHRERSRAVADALVSAQQVAADVRAQSEAERAEQQREVAGIKDAAEAEAMEIREHARQEATEIVRESRVRADRVVDEVAIAIKGYHEDTDEFLDDARTRLDTLVQVVLERIPATAAPVPVEVEAPVEAPVADADEPPADAVVAA
jgi:cell division septum initiation protein DivIVA